MNFLEAFDWLKEDTNRVVIDKGGVKYKMDFHKCIISGRIYFDDNTPIEYFTGERWQ